MSGHIVERGAMIRGFCSRILPYNLDDIVMYDI